MSDMQDKPSYITTGTTAPIFVARGVDPITVRPGEHYFLVKIKSAQAAFHGSFWERAKQLIVTSQVDLNLKNHPSLSEPLRTIQHSRQVAKDSAVKLGISSNLINLVPATMTHVMISVEFILDIKNSLLALGSLINEESFMSAVSLAPGAAMAARTISRLSQKILQTFMEPEELKPILQFRGDFNIPTDDLKDGYYVILGTRDKAYPISRPLTNLRVQDGEVWVDNKPVTQWSYVVLEVRSQKARTRDLHDGADWELRLREADTEAQGIAGDPFADEQQKRQSWDKCTKIIKESHILLQADPNYLRSEVNAIVRQAYLDCHIKIWGYPPKGASSATEAVRGKSQYNVERRTLGISEDEDLEAAVAKYVAQVAEARRAMSES